MEEAIIEQFLGEVLIDGGIFIEIIEKRNVDSR
jgi:hypothetical protein